MRVIEYEVQVEKEDGVLLDTQLFEYLHDAVGVAVSEAYYWGIPVKIWEYVMENDEFVDYGCRFWEVMCDKDWNIKVEAY